MKQSNAMKRERNFWGLARIVSCRIGQWPYQTKNELRVHRLLFFMMYSFQVIPEIAAIIRYNDDVEVILETMSSFMIDLAILVNISTFFLNSDKMRMLLERIKEDWNILSRDNELQILLRSSELGRKVSILYSGGVLLATVLYITEPLHMRLVYFLVQSNVSLPKNFSTPMYFGPIDGEQHYYSLLLISGICILTMITVIVATDLLFFIYAQHSCGLFVALGFTVAIEDIYVWNFLGMIGLNMIIISVTAVQVVRNVSAMQKLIKVVAFTLGQITHLFIQCLMAQRITDNSLGVQQSIMNAKWYYSTARVRRLITFMTMRSQNPCQLTAGKVVYMSLNTFSTIIRTSVTYFTVFMDMQ